MEVAAQHNWMAEETVEDTLIIREARRSANVDRGVVNEDEVSSSSDEEEASKDKLKNSVYFNEVIDAVDFHVVLNGDHHTGNANGQINETGNPKGEILSTVCVPLLHGQNSPVETGNPKGEIILDVCVPLLHGQNLLDETENQILSGVCQPLLYGQNLLDETENPKGVCGQNSLDETGKYGKGEILPGVWLPPNSQGHDSQSSSSIRKGSGNETIIEQVEEETVELEFFDTTAVDKLKHTHNAYCPKCNSRITKVVLRRVKRERRIIIETDDDRHDQKSELLGCLSCFSVFVRIGKKLNPFPIFGNGGGTTSTEIAGESHLPNTDEGGFIPGIMPPKKSPAEIIESKGDDYRIPILEDPRASPSTGHSSNPQRPILPVEVKDSRSLEIVKCIVYGGLIEAITSLGVVSSAAASDADTMKIVTIGVANLIGGLFVICQNLVDLKYSVGGGSNYQVDRYGELLGQRKNFPLHATFAMLSYFVFGLIPPVIYGFTFRKSDDRDYKLIAVAAASLLCVIILAAAKAYTQRANKFSKYFKTILSYVIAAGMVSGVGYAAGHLIKRLMDDMGWFDSKPISQNPAWASY
ncbi:membrane protein of ER body 2-like [Solanum tuberosum]|uniref:Membrane protein of ER body-like protein n=2 Tax=Solanum tuberosum TaxID=4113 RepID=M1CPD6_SOLTU|nr:PREDICTED: membrane protein of ER body 2-like [Solanum tuberosum]